MADHRFQLVIQFAASTSEDFTSLLEIEDYIEAGLTDLDDAVVDGHDFGAGEFNIFIHTNEPNSTLKIVRTTISSERPGSRFGAGYREITGDGYTRLWPLNSEPFTIS